MDNIDELTEIHRQMADLNRKLQKLRGPHYVSNLEEQNRVMEQIGVLSRRKDLILGNPDQASEIRQAIRDAMGLDRAGDKAD